MCWPRSAPAGLSPGSIRRARRRGPPTRRASGARPPDAPPGARPSRAGADRAAAVGDAVGAVFDAHAVPVAVIDDALAVAAVGVLAARLQQRLPVLAFGDGEA